MSDDRSTAPPPETPPPDTADNGNGGQSDGHIDTVSVIDLAAP